MTLLTYESEQIAPLLLDYEDTPDKDERGYPTHAFETLINAVAKAQWDTDRLVLKKIYKDEADWLEKWLLNFTGSSAGDKIDCLKKVKIRIEDLRKMTEVERKEARHD